MPRLLRAAYAMGGSCQAPDLRLTLVCFTRAPRSRASHVVLHLVFATLPTAQVMPSLAEVADVLEYGLPKSSDDDAFAEMDRLADML